MIKSYLETELQRGSESLTSLVKRGWVPNGPVFECHLNTGQPDHLNAGPIDAIFLTVEHRSYKRVFKISYEILTRPQPPHPPPPHPKTYPIKPKNLFHRS